MSIDALLYQCFISLVDKSNFNDFVSAVTIMIIIVDSKKQSDWNNCFEYTFTNANIAVTKLLKTTIPKIGSSQFITFKYGICQQFHTHEQRVCTV